MSAVTPSPDAIAAYLESTDRELESYVNETHHMYLDIYLGRMHALHAAGAEPREVIKAAWLASRCYADNAPLYIAKWPPFKVRSRRLLPAELALIGGDLQVHEAIVKSCGLDIMILLAAQADRTLTAELAQVTRWYPARKIVDLADLVGALAVLYGAGLTAIMDEAPDSFGLVVGTADMLLEQNWGMLRKPSAGVARIVAAHQAMMALQKGDPAAFVDSLATCGRAHAMAVEAAWAEDADGAARGDGALDATALALVCVADAMLVKVREALDAAPDDLEGLDVPKRYARVLAG